MDADGEQDPARPGQAAQGLAFAAEVKAGPGPPGSLGQGPASGPRRLRPVQACPSHPLAQNTPRPRLPYTELYDPR